MKIGRIARRLWPWLAAVASGLAYAACFDPFNQSWLCWICLTPLLGAVWFSGRGSRFRWLRNLGLGYLSGLVFFWTVFSWLTTVTVPGWFLLEFYMGLYLAVWAWFCGLVRPRSDITAIPDAATPDKWSTMLRAARHDASEKPPASPWLQSWRNLLLAFVIASAWVATEWLRSWIFSGWGWNGLGAALHENWIIIQVAEFTGILGLSFVVAFANVIVVTTVRRLILEAHGRAMRPHWDLNFTMLGVVGLIVFGWHAAKTPRPSHPLRVAAVQADIPRQDFAEQRLSDREIIERFRTLSLKALTQNAPPELLIWPESSIPGSFNEDEADSHFVRRFAAEAGTNIILGAVVREESRTYNAALFVTDAGQTVQIYRKLHLVPFGEYIPGRYAIPLFARIIGDQVPGDFDVGKDYTIFPLNDFNVQVAPLICFEDTIGELTRHFILPQNGAPGANLLVNITNDAWFKDSAGSRQHLANAIFRCVETRRPMVRAANTGVTCFITPLGRVSYRLPAGRDTLCHEIEVPSDNEITFYVRHGDLAGPISAAIAGLTITGVLGLRLLGRGRNKPGRSPAPA